MSRRRYIFEPQAEGTSPEKRKAWRKRFATPLNLDEHREHVLAYLTAIQTAPNIDGKFYNRLIRQMGREGHPIYPKARLLNAYEQMVEEGTFKPNQQVELALTKKPTRTVSGVAPVTVFTKPYTCPGKCIFCPTDPTMPKSYLSNEPAGQRAITLKFDPYEQVRQRIDSMVNTGHTVDKIEIIIVGGTWSSYPLDYREWFVKRCFEGLNRQEAPSLEAAQTQNETARFRNTGITIETRPDHITLEEVRHLRRMGVTRVQLGTQTLDDRISELNDRGETAADTYRAIHLLRSAGFKVVIHWMPNLLGATPEGDLRDFLRFWDEPALRPDEMKLYPTGLLRGTRLYDFYEQGEYQPYDEQTLAALLKAAKKRVPRYCRLNRVMRDIPAPDIAAGVTTSNLRQVVQNQLKEEGTPCQCIRCREVRSLSIEPTDIHYHQLEYATNHSRELFLSADTSDDQLAGFLRLSLPTSPTPLPELHNHAIIRQVQVYGPAQPLNSNTSNGEGAQHHGIGTELLQQALTIAKNNGFKHIAVIAAVGTRNYYRRFDFEVDGLYMTKAL